MPATNRIGGTLEDVLSGTRTMGHDGIAMNGAVLGEVVPSVFSRFRKVGQRIAPVADDLVIGTASMGPGTATAFPDSNDAQKAHEFGGRLGERLKERKAHGPQGKNPDTDDIFGLKGTEPTPTPAQELTTKPATTHPSKPAEAPYESEGTKLFTQADKIIEPMQTVATVVGLGSMAPEVLRGAGWVAGKMGNEGLKTTLRKPYNYLYPELKEGAPPVRTAGTNLQDGIQVLFTGLQAYGVAKGAMQGLDSLKNMYADMTGVSAKNVSAMSLLTSNDVPELVKEARTHYRKEYVTRGLIQTLGIGLAIRGLRRPTGIGIMEFGVPMAANWLADNLMGESVLPYYSGFSNAYKSGQPLKQEDYAAFLIASSAELKSRGAIGKQVAFQVAAQYLAEHTSPGDILKEIEESQKAHKQGKTAKFDNRIHDILGKAEADHAAKVAARKARQLQKAQALEQGLPAAGVAAPATALMADRLNNKEHRPVVGDGKFTKMLNEENHGLAPQIT